MEARLILMYRTKPNSQMGILQLFCSDGDSLFRFQERQDRPRLQRALRTDACSGFRMIVEMLRHPPAGRVERSEGRVTSFSPRVGDYANTISRSPQYRGKQRWPA